MDLYKKNNNFFPNVKLELRKELMKNTISLIILSSFLVCSCLSNKSNNEKNNPNIYSEYYANQIAQFKGTIVFENGSGTDLKKIKKNEKTSNL